MFVLPVKDFFLKYFRMPQSVKQYGSRLKEMQICQIWHANKLCQLLQAEKKPKINETRS